MTTQDQLLIEAQEIAHGLSNVEPSELHLIAMSEEIKRLSDKVGLLLRTIAMLDKLNNEAREQRLS